MIRKIIFWLFGYTKRRNKYTRVLNERSTALSKVNSPGSMVWITLTLSYIKEIFGPDSPEYDYLKMFRFSDPPEKDEVEVSAKRHTQYAENKVLAEEFLEGCRTLVKDKRLYSRPYENVFSKMDGKALAAWMSLFGSALVIGSISFGRYLQDRDSLKMEGEIEVLETKLSNANRVIAEQQGTITKLEKLIPSPFGTFGSGSGLSLGPIVNNPYGGTVLSPGTSFYDVIQKSGMTSDSMPSKK